MAEESHSKLGRNGVLVVALAFSEQVRAKVCVCRQGFLLQIRSEAWQTCRVDVKSLSNTARVAEVVLTDLERRMKTLW